MKKILKYLKVVFCIIIISFTAVGTYSYFTFGELYYGKFLDEVGKVIEGRGSGKTLTDEYIYYKNEKIDSQAVNLPEREIKITIEHIDGNAEPKSNFTPTKILYQINNSGWDDNNVIENPIMSNTSYIFVLNDFKGGSFQFKIVAQKSDGTNVMTNAFRLKDNEATLSYYGTNDYLGCENFKPTNVSIVDN